MADVNGRIRLYRSGSVAFAPAVITNFFRIEYDGSGRLAGATGGGYVLSKGTKTWAVLHREEGRGLVTKVNGDLDYDARTTRRALGLMLADVGYKGGLSIEQDVETPIGAGFGASGASATSAVYSAASALGVSRSRRELAHYAHRAELDEKTGLGTVSVIYNHVGAGAITKPGVPGDAKFVSVKFPNGIRLVTACLAPFDKRDAFSSRSVSQRINRFGEEALRALLSDPSVDTLGREGEIFSAKVGLESVEVKKLIHAAKSAGALYASQNMIGYSVHSLVPADISSKVAAAIRSMNMHARVDIFEIGRKRAGTLRPSRRSRAPS